MTPAKLLRVLAAPEILVVDLADAALTALRLALLAVHPSPHRAPTHDPHRRCAHALLRTAARLQRHLRAYRRAVDTVLDQPDDQLPF